MDNKQFLEFIKNAEVIKAGSEAHLKMHELSARAQKITMRLNYGYHEPEETVRLFSELTESKVDDSFRCFLPFYTECGINIKLGKNVFINSGCCFQDHAGIEIGDGTLIGHQVVIATINHAQDPVSRADMFPKPVKIGKNVWIGANCTICPGVSIGDNTVIGAGSVVTKDIPSGVVAVGNPARVLRTINESDRIPSQHIISSIDITI